MSFPQHIASAVGSNEGLDVDYSIFPNIYAAVNSSSSSSSSTTSMVTSTTTTFMNTTTTFMNTTTPEPWIMTPFDKVWLQVGWAVQAVLTVLLLRLAFVYWPYKFRYPAPPPSSDAPYSSAACDGLSEFLYETLWGENELSSYANAVIIFVGVLNLLMFSLETENRFDENAVIPLTEIPLSTWVSDTNWWVQLFSIAFVILMILLRMKGAQAHPKLQRFGGRASFRWFAGSFYAHVEVLVIIPSMIEIVVNNDMFDNLIWIILIRSVSWVERQPDTGKAIRQFRHMLNAEGPLLTNMFVFALVLWVLLSGFYFIANYDNDKSHWDAAVVEGTGETWQRFESIPAAMFFVLINLCKENPLADVHETLWSRLLVMSVCLIAVPLFAMPAGVLGSTLQRYVLDVDEIVATPPPQPLDAEMAELRGRSALAEPTYRSDENKKEDQDWDEPTEKPLTCWQKFEQSWANFLANCVLSFGSVFVYFFHTASTESHKENPDYVYVGILIFVDAWLWAWVDGIVAGFFALGWLMRVPCRGVCYICSFDGIVDFLSWAPGGVHLTLWILGLMPEEGHGKRILNALCIFRVLKPERFCGAFRDMADILVEHAAILKATFFMTMCLWLGFSCALFYTERDSADGEMQENYGSMGRSLWAEAINLHGEWVWCDYSAVGKGICTLIALFSSGLFMVPIAVFSDGYQDKLGNQDDVDFDVQPWQGDARPGVPGVRQKVYDLLYCHLHLIERKNIRDERRSLREDALSLRHRLPGSNYGSEGSPPPSFAKPPDRDPLDFLHTTNLVLRSTKDVVEGQTPPRWGFFPPPRKPKAWGWTRLTLGFQVFRVASVCMTGLMTVTTIALTMDYFERDTCRTHKGCRIWDVVLYGLDTLAAMFFSVEFWLRCTALTWQHPLSFVGLCDMLSLAMLWATLTTLRSTVFHPEYTSAFIVDDLAVPIRLLRLVCLESYCHAFHVFTRVLWINRGSLVRAGYALMVIWYMFSTVLYLFEHNPDAAKDRIAEIEAGTEEDPIMAMRYPDILTGLQYSLVHLTGDYPVSEYTFVSKIAHLFAIVFGMCTMAAFTGVFVAGYTTYYKSERVVERKQDAQRRLHVVIFTVIAVQRRWRMILRRRVARQIAAAAGVDMPRAIILSDDDAARQFQHVRQAQLKGALQGIFLQNTPEGKRILLVFQLALIINIIGNLITSMPEVEDNERLLMFLDFIEFFTGYVFLAEYSIHLLAANEAQKKFLEGFRLLDLFCLIPTFWRLWFVGQPHRWQKNHGQLMRVIDLALIVRIVRILDFPYVRRTRKRISKAISTAFRGLLPAAVLALTIWIITTSLFTWCEHKYDGPEAENLNNMPDALYWTSIFIIGEWANVDFSPGAGSRMCIFYCLFGVATFAVPVGLMMEAVESTIVMAAEEQKQLIILLTKSKSSVLE